MPRSEVMKRLGVSRPERLHADASGVSRRTFLVSAPLAAAGLHSIGTRRAVASVPASAYGAEVPAAWFELALDLVRTTPGFTPPVASRALGYAGVTLYEALASGRHGGASLAGRLNELSPLPPPTDVAYHW